YQLLDSGTLALTTAFDVMDFPHPLTRPCRALSTACQTCIGVIGIAISVTPSGASASRTALTTPAVAPILAPSPTPLTPNGFKPVGISARSVSNAGRSVACGIA